MKAETFEVEAGQVWLDEAGGHVRVLAVADGYAMLRRRRRNPFVATTAQMVAGEYGWRLHFAAPRACAVCGCTDAKACEGGCRWVGERVCSACVGP